MSGWRGSSLVRPEARECLGSGSGSGSGGKRGRGEEEQEEEEEEREGFFSGRRAELYARNPGVLRTQKEMAHAVWGLAMLGLREEERRVAALVLDVGCGSAVFANFARERQEIGGVIGVDLSRAMLEQAQMQQMKLGRFSKSTLAQANMLQLPFGRANVFDFIVSISCVQWAAAVSATIPQEEADKIREQNVDRLFRSVSNLLQRRCIMQFYPADEKEAEIFVNSAKKFGLFGGLIVDAPHEDKRTKFTLLFDKKVEIRAKTRCFLARKYHATCPLGLCLENNWNYEQEILGEDNHQGKYLWSVHVRKLHQILRLCKRIKEGGTVPDEELPTNLEIAVADRVFSAFGGMELCKAEGKISVAFLGSRTNLPILLQASHPIFNENENENTQS